MTASNIPKNYDFRTEMTGVLPHLRAFARGLCGRPDYADDLVQETMLKAWAARDSFQPGTSMRSWTFVILRNVYLSEARRNRFRGDYDPDLAEKLLSQPAGQEDGLHMGDLRAAMMRLSPERREALLLVGAGGFSYEEAADIAQCAVGTMKSRVARARRSLEDMLGDEGEKGGRSKSRAVSHTEMLADLDKVASL
ncbi:RNA polymerase sigma-70 factor (ECF subfamily) [Sphingobium sp. B1D7B]|nr:RNA polymerase sigma-70 factor (ECF subfamily) [Sphingobium sp. B7D2B]MCW2369983.1 RNA polymerase sigma-70 factor (ECF subfamily) [Sphingobium sp. B11D3D]MCW2383960.1 RNA polymerase sigma-70 factor (ECF subfamily) [Sphingobium sp. B2D3D]MCW2393495.1 RNA polymerase sigma-70 factor (ECF subfamily) [Sphingobium sp. B11D3A]MCW2405432.1 RNA polymerase sigma-70 factor (ECF subfamily) [Sphingobium sp. B1D7B]MCW2408016.1 RNA polymerase sigma-70 factor (ECF subfamily) [Sphingobium xanthum]MCW241165